MKRLVSIPKSKYRVVISEVLPYERPLFFSNRFFARFLKYYGVKCQDGELVATKHQEPGLDEYLKILGGSGRSKKLSFNYTISKDGVNAGRNLSVIHPYHQVEMVEFYEKYRSLLLYYCHRSHFSIRYPEKVASYQNKRDTFHATEIPELNDASQSENIRHYFTYKKYRNISAFFDDYRFIRAEKAFPFMRRMDIKKCFESIKPEQLTEAVLQLGFADAVGTFAYEFAEMQESYGGLTMVRG